MQTAKSGEMHLLCNLYCSLYRFELVIVCILKRIVI